MRNEQPQEVRSADRCPRCALAAPVRDGGARRPVGPERRRAAGDLHDPPYACRDRGLDRRAPRADPGRVRAASAGTAARRPPARLAATAGRAGRRAPPAAEGRSRLGSRTSARASASRCGEPAATWRPIVPVAPSTAIMPPPPRAGSLAAHARADRRPQRVQRPAATRRAPPHAKTNRSGRSSAQSSASCRCSHGSSATSARRGRRRSARRRAAAGRGRDHRPADAEALVEPLGLGEERADRAAERKPVRAWSAKAPAP